MSAVKELEQVLTLDQAQRLADCDSSEPTDSIPIQQLLDELLGCLEDDDSPMFREHSPTADSFE